MPIFTSKGLQAFINMNTWDWLLNAACGNCLMDIKGQDQRSKSQRVCMVSICAYYYHAFVNGYLIIKISDSSWTH